MYDPHLVGVIRDALVEFYEEKLRFDVGYIAESEFSSMAEVAAEAVEKYQYNGAE